MPPLPYGALRPFLFQLDAERAHDATLAALEATQGNALRLAYQQERVHDPIWVAGMPFANRVGMAAGLDKNARCIDALGAMGFGFVEVGTVTPLAQGGNPKPRMFRLPQAQALINRLGFNNQGLGAFLRHVQASRLRRSAKPWLRLGLNIGKNAATPMERAVDDYLQCLDGVYAYADYITVNISSPNTANLRSLQSDAALDALLQALDERRQDLARRHGSDKPLFLKIAPDLDNAQIDAVAATLKRYGCDAAGRANQRWGLIATNTTLSRDAVQGLAWADEAGGLSGAPLLASSNAVLARLRAAMGPDFPIMGVGGILSAQDAVAKIHAGADLVQIYTGLIYHGPALVPAAARAIAALRQPLAPEASARATT